MTAVAAPPADEDLLSEATELAQQAGRLTLPWFQSPDLAVDHKADGTPVTEADRAAERFLRDEIAGRYPDDAILGEEEGARPGSSGRRWVIDPIDGTKAFTRGVPLYSTLLALDDEHGPAVGVIDLPALGRTVSAARGRGCFANGRPARVSPRTEIAGSWLTTSGFGYWQDEAILAVKHARMEMQTWGDGYGYVLVATGDLEAMVDPVAAPWDLAPMPVIVNEAGGRYSDFGGTSSVEAGTGLASNGLIHEELLQILGG